MPVISISLNDQILSELDAYQKSLGFTGRSEIIRAGIRSFMSDEKQKANMSGVINAIILVTHDDEYDNVASDLASEHEDVVTTRIHSKIEGNKCMELFVLKGDTKEVLEMSKKYSTNRHMNAVKMIVL